MPKVFRWRSHNLAYVLKFLELSGRTMTGMNDHSVEVTIPHAFAGAE